MFRFFAYLKMLVIFQITVSNISAQDKNSWPVFRGNPELTGFTSADLPDKLSLKWSFKANGELKSSAVIDNKLIFFGTTDGLIYAIDFTGKQKWQYKAEVGFEASPVVVNKTVIIGSLDGTVYALESETGKLKWKYKTEGQISGSANIYNTGKDIYIIVPSYDYALHCISLKTGKAVWKCETDNYINGTPTVANGKIFIGSCDANYRTIDAKTGKELNKLDLGTYIAGSSTVVGDFAFVGDYDGNFFGLQISANKIIWKYTNTAVQPFLASPAVYKNKIYIGSHDKKVYCFDATTGKSDWTFQTQGKIESSIVVTNQKMIVCSKDGKIRFLSFAGKEIWKYELGVAISNSPAVVENFIIVGATNGSIYCFGK